MLKFFNSKKVMLWVLILAGFFVYANALPNQMFWDDDDGILKNAYIRDWQNVEKFFSENLIAGAGLNSNYWRPLLLISYATEWHLWENWAPGYHLVNILLHIAASMLLFLFLSQLIKKRVPAFLAALIFLIHPLQTEAVTYVSGRADPLSTLFIFLGLLSYLKFRQVDFGEKSVQKCVKKAVKRKFTPVWIYFCLGLMTKEKTVIVYPALLVLIDLFLLYKNDFRERLNNFWKFILEEVKRLWPIFSIAIFYALLRYSVLNFKNTYNLYDQANQYTESILVRIFTFLWVLPQYIGLMIFPRNLHMERSVDFVTTPFNYLVALGFVLMTLFIFLIIYWRHRKPERSFALLWFLVTLFPASGILIPVAGLMYEHYLYLPLIGFFLFWIVLISDLIKKLVQNNKFIKKAGILFLSGYLLFLGISTIKRNAIWRDPITFYEDVVRYNDQSLRVWNNLGMAYANAGEPEKAVRAYTRAVELDEGGISAPPHHNLGNLYKTLGQNDKAVQEFQKAIEIDNDFYFSYAGLINFYLAQEDYEQALFWLYKAKAQFPKRYEFDSLIKKVEEMMK